ncbi:unnamed protein product [Rhizophagus irregularis]|nr:unnamed protein product [Rhizophagus irregularis]
MITNTVITSETNPNSLVDTASPSQTDNLPTSTSLMDSIHVYIILDISTEFITKSSNMSAVKLLASALPPLVKSTSQKSEFNRLLYFKFRRINQK